MNDHRSTEAQAIRFATITVALMAGLILGALLWPGANTEEPKAAMPELSLPELPSDAPIDPESGLIMVEGYELVKAHCGACHSTRLVIQNRQSRKGWKSLIRWMQREHRLWDLGEQEGQVLDYLARCYAPQKKGRRKKLENIDWYELEE